MNEFDSVVNKNVTHISDNGESVWSCPESGWTKVNADGAFSSSSEKAGIGVVLRNDCGELIGGIGKQVKTGFALVSEAFALRHGVN